MSPVVTALRVHAFPQPELVPSMRPSGYSNSWVTYLAQCARQRRCREASPLAAGGEHSLASPHAASSCLVLSGHIPPLPTSNRCLQTVPRLTSRSHPSQHTPYTQRRGALRREHRFPRIFHCSAQAEPANVYCLLVASHVHTSVVRQRHRVQEAGDHRIHLDAPQ
jgi:hypothetical protein